MKLIPPDRGRFRVKVRLEAAEAAAEEDDRIETHLIRKIDRFSRDELGVHTVPRDWLAFERFDLPEDGTVEFRLEATAPTRSRTVLLPSLGQERTFQIPVSTKSPIPIVPSPYRYADTNPYRRADHVLTFKGWDGETGLMVFDR